VFFGDSLGGGKERKLVFLATRGARWGGADFASKKKTLCFFWRNYLWGAGWGGG